MLIVFAGSIARFPIGGHAWANLQYLCGLRDLGHQVYYLEDFGERCWFYVWENDETLDDPECAAAYLESCLQPFGFGAHWTLRAGERMLGLPPDAFGELCGAADLLLVRAVAFRQWRPEYDRPRRRAFIDVDPGFTQASLARGEPALNATLARCERLFTVGQRIGCADCRVPLLGREWLPLPPPVWLPGWPYVEQTDASAPFTTIMQWRSYGAAHVYNGLRHDCSCYGQKDEAFGDYLDLPARTPRRMCLALSGGPSERLRGHGWQVLTGWRATRTPELYRRFIQRSQAEFAPAKRGYVLNRSGWFSDRSVCYLASGRPVLVEDTGFADRLPMGDGVVTFRTPEEALAGIAAIEADYASHAHAARILAETRFATERVLPQLFARL
jgi:hypothetical protein